MLPKIRQQAWIRCLPGLDKEGGIPLETLPIATPMADERSLSVMLYGSSELVSNLQSLSKQQTTLPTLSLVVRTDAAKELDYEFLMTDAVIASVLPIKDLAGAQAVNIFFNSISMKLALTGNPGPPVNCPPIQLIGMNTGWIFGLPNEEIKSGKPVEVVDFTPPHFNRRLTVTFGEPSSEIQNQIRNPGLKRELVLVLPDRVTQRYVEFKLWNAEINLLEDERQIAFESDMIVCLTGYETRPIQKQPSNCSHFERRDRPRVSTLLPQSSPD